MSKQIQALPSRTVQASGEREPTTAGVTCNDDIKHCTVREGPHSLWTGGYSGWDFRESPSQNSNSRMKVRNKEGLQTDKQRLQCSHVLLNGHSWALVQIQQEPYR